MMNALSSAGLGLRRYGIVLLVVEVMGTSTVLIYGLCLLFHTVQEHFQEDPHHPGMPKVLCSSLSCFVNL